MEEALIGLTGGLSALLVAGGAYVRSQTRRNGNGVAGVLKEIQEMRREESEWRTSLRPILTEMASSLAVLRDRR